MQPSQCSANKTVSVLKELFSKHGIPETLRSDNGPQFANHMFAEFAKEWNFDHNTSLPRNPKSNGQAEAAVKFVKGLLSKAKYSGQDPHLALLAYRSTPIDAHLQSPAEMLHKGSATWSPMLQMTMTDVTNLLPRVLNTMTVTAEPSPHCMQGKLFVLNNDKNLWLPAKVIHKDDNGSYLAPEHHNKLLLQQLQTLYTNHHLPCAHHSDSRCLPLEVHQSRLVQHLLPLTNQLMSVSHLLGILRRYDPD